MAQIQLLRNKDKYSSRENALSGMVNEAASLADGSPLLARYDVSGETRTVLGIVNSFSATDKSLTTIDTNYIHDNIAALQVDNIKLKENVENNTTNISTNTSDIATVKALPAYSATTEEFTFTLEDGTTITKKILLL